MNYSVIELALIGLAAVLGIAVLFAIFAKIYIGVSYLSGNTTQTRNGLDGEKAALLLIEKYNLEGVQVKRANWFLATIYGNYYNVRKKIIYLRGNIFSKASVTSVALAVQKVALALESKKGGKLLKFRAVIQPTVLLAPALFVPFTVLGVILDLILKSNIGVFSLVFFGIAFLFYLLAFIFTMITIPIEKKANKVAIEMISQTNILEGEEQVRAKKIYNAYIVSYIADFIVSILYIIQYVLKITVKITKKNRR